MRSIKPQEPDLRNRWRLFVLPGFLTRPTRLPRHVIDEVVDIEVLLDLLILRVGSDAGVAEILQCGPGRFGSINGFTRVERVPFLFFSTKMRGREWRTWPFRRIVEAPIKTVDVEMNEVAVSTRLPHRALGLAHPFVFGERSAIRLTGAEDVAVVHESGRPL